MRTITLYNYNELPEAVKAIAIESCRSEVGVNLAEMESLDYRDTLKRIEDVFNIKVEDLEGMRWRYKGDLEIYNPNHLCRYFEDIWNDVFKGKYYSSYRIYDKHRHSKVNYDDECFSICGMWTDLVVRKVMKNRYEYVRAGWNIDKFVRYMLWEFLKAWEQDECRAYSDECIEEELTESYDWLEFTEDGKMFHN